MNLGQDKLYLIEGFSSILTFPYGLYVLWQLKYNQIDLLKNINAFQQQELFIGKSNFIQNVFRYIAGLLRISFILFLLVLAGLIFMRKSPYTYSINLGFSLYATVIMLSFNTVLLLASRIWNLLSTIYKLRRQNTNINLFDLSSLYKLSQFTQKIALYLLPLSVAFGLIITPSFVNRNTFDFASLKSAHFIEMIIFLLGPSLILIAGSVFMMPVLWIRKRIIETKSKVLAEIGERLHITFKEQDQNAEQGNFTKVIELQSYAKSLITRKDFILKVSDWPWEGRIFREFSAAILVPIFLWVLQYYLTRWLEH